MNEIRPSWNDIHKMTMDIAAWAKANRRRINHVEPSDNPFQGIVGISRGGLIPAVILSHELKLPLTCIDYSSPDGAGDDKRVEFSLPPINQRDILIVDDIADTGRTLFETTMHYLKRGHFISTAALYWKESDIHTEFYAQKLPADAPWVIFPWE